MKADIDQINSARRQIKAVALAVQELRTALDPRYAPETIANVTLAYRHLEDASMRLGKAIQALDGGTSVYDREVTVGA
jgi:hypothetical protein